MKNSSFFQMFMIILLSGCASSSVSFVSKTPVLIEVYDLKSQKKLEEETSKGKTFNLNELTGKIVHFNKPGFNGKSFVFYEGDSSSDAKIDIKLSPIELNALDNEVAAKNRNKSYRTLLSAYHALLKKNFSVSEEIAKKLAEEDKHIAAPYIIVGLVQIQQGNFEQAKSAFAKAKSLDPEDPQIDKLLEIASR